MFPCFHVSIQLQLMEINKPDRGVFRGMGQLEGSNIQNRKNFPRIRNAHQYEYTHLHRNDYVTSFQRYFTTNKNNNTTTQKVKGNSNQSTLQLGSDPKNYVSSLSRTDYRHFEKVVPPKPIRHKEEWAGLGDEPKDNHFVTTTMEKFGKLEEPGKHRVTFKNRGANRFNPITGEPRTLAFGFQDFQMGRKNNFTASNFTVTPQRHEHIDIISGRKLTFQ